MGRAQKEPLKVRIKNLYDVKASGFGKAWKGFNPASGTVSGWIAAHPVISDAIELEEWAHPERHTRAARRAGAASLVGELPYDMAVLALKVISGRKGRPLDPEIRGLAIEALEAKVHDPRFSWQWFAKERCTCGETQHGIRCKERIRQAAMKLEHLLQRLHTEV